MSIIFDGGLIGKLTRSNLKFFSEDGSEISLSANLNADGQFIYSEDNNYPLPKSLPVMGEYNPELDCYESLCEYLEPETDQKIVFKVVFLGWYFNKSYTTVATAGFVPPDKNTVDSICGYTLYAKWRLSPNNQPIKFKITPNNYKTHILIHNFGENSTDAGKPLSNNVFNTYRSWTDISTSEYYKLPYFYNNNSGQVAGLKFNTDFFVDLALKCNFIVHFYTTTSAGTNSIKLWNGNDSYYDSKERVKTDYSSYTAKWEEALTFNSIAQSDSPNYTIGIQRSNSYALPYIFYIEIFISDFKYDLTSKPYNITFIDNYSSPNIEYKYNNLFKIPNESLWPSLPEDLTNNSTVYDFDKTDAWYYIGDGGQKQSLVETKDLTKNLEVYPKWSLKSDTIKVKLFYGASTAPVKKELTVYTTQLVDLTLTEYLKKLPLKNINYYDRTEGKIYKFKDWEIFNIDASTIPPIYEVKAKYERSSGYGFTTENIWREIFYEAEPYYYGIGDPTIDFFKPIGEDNNDKSTDDLKIQAVESSSYIETAEWDSFRIKNKPIKYIKKGTFPKLNSSFPLYKHTDPMPGSTKIEETDFKIINTTPILQISYNNKKITNIKFNNGTTNYTPDYFKDNYNLNTCPARIGFVLVGAGGGAGGYYSTDTDDKSSGEYWAFVPGTGGGGGEIVLGVLNLICPEITATPIYQGTTSPAYYLWTANNNIIYGYTSSEENILRSIYTESLTLGAKKAAYDKFNHAISEDDLIDEIVLSDIRKDIVNYWLDNYEDLFSTLDLTALSYTENLQSDLNLEVTEVMFSIGGGTGGKGNGGKEVRGGTSCADGQNGEDTKLYLTIYLKDAQENKYRTKRLLVAKAYGGGGGKKGKLSTGEYTGGVGGYNSNHTENFPTETSCCWIVKSYAGGEGGGFTIQNDTGAAKKLPAYNQTLYFNSYEPENIIYKQIISYPELAQAGSGNQDDKTWSLRGGYSYGEGGSGSATPEKGGGGASVKLTAGDGADDSHTENKSISNEVTTGADGWIGFYY